MHGKRAQEIIVRKVTSTIIFAQVGLDRAVFNYKFFAGDRVENRVGFVA